MKLNLIPRIKELYETNNNIIDFLKKSDNREHNTTEDILISYDFQAGSYIEIIENDLDYINNYTEELLKVINNHSKSFSTIMEVGVGEATTLCHLQKKVHRNVIFMGFDISWSRIKFGKEYLESKSQQANLFVANLFEIPLADSSIDVVYSSHSLEPNGGREVEALKELYRVTKNTLVLLEPAYEFASNNFKKRMKKNGYVTDLKLKIIELGYNLVEYKKFPVIAHDRNPTGLYVILKEDKKNKANLNFTCPISKDDLIEHSDHYFSKTSLISYPKINEIPCLLTDYAVLTTKHS